MDADDAPDELLLADYLADWLEVQRTRVQPSTWHEYAGNVSRYFAPVLGEVHLRALTVARLEDFYARMVVCGGHGGKPLSLKTVQRAAGVLHKALADAARLDLVPENVAAKATLPRIDPNATETRELRTWTAEELRRFLDVTVEDPLWPLWVLAAGTGMRRGEVLGLRWQDVDTDGAKVHVRGALSVVGGVARRKTTKAGRSRTLHVDAKVITGLERQRRAQDRRREQLGASWHNEWGLVFTGPQGEHVWPQRITDAWRELVRRHDVPNIRLHDLRHTHATLLLAAGCPMKVVSERLGHANISTTMDVYAHVLPAMDAEAAERFAQVVWGEPASDGTDEGNES